MLWSWSRSWRFLIISALNTLTGIELFPHWGIRIIELKSFWLSYLIFPSASIKLLLYFFQFFFVLLYLLLSIQELLNPFILKERAFVSLLGFACILLFGKSLIGRVIEPDCWIEHILPFLNGIHLGWYLSNWRIFELLFFGRIRFEGAIFHFIFSFSFPFCVKSCFPVFIPLFISFIHILVALPSAWPWKIIVTLSNT